MTPEQQRAVALARAKAKARARGVGKTYTQFQSFNEGIGEGVYLSARDEAEGGAAVRRRLGGGGLDQIAKSIPFGEIPLAVFDAAGGFVQDLAPGLYGGGVQKVYEDARDERRTIQKVAAADNPLSYGGGQILGSTVTLAPVSGAGARSSAMVADDLLREGAKLTTKAAAAKSAPRAAALTAKATAKTARAAQLAKPAATIGEFTARASRIAGESAAKGVGYGAGIGGGLGFTAGEGDVGDRLTTASDAAVVGGIAGGVLGPVIQGLAPLIGGIAYKITTPKEVKGLDMVIKRMQRSGTTPEGIKAQFDLWNKTGEVPETLAEFMGPNERSLLSALITVNRETREQATNIFVNRGREEVNRLEDAFAGSFGAKRGDYAAAQTQAAKARVEDPEPFYKTAHFEKDGSLKPLSPEKMSALNNILADEDDIVRIAKDATADLNRMGNKSPAHKAARDEVRMYAEALQAARRGERVQVPQLSVLAADYIERAINQSYKAAGGGSGEISGSIAGWKALRNSVRDVIDDTGIGEARATSAERIRRGELLEEGLNIMKTSVDVDDVNRIMTGIPDAGIPAASEAGRRAYGVGASRAVANELRNVPNMAGFADATRKVARTPALREKLEAARPKVLTKSGAENKGSKQTKANAALDQAIERASDRAQFGVDMVGNSRTAFRQGDVTDAVMDDAMSQQAGEVIGDLLISGVGGVTQRLQDRLGRVIGNRLGQPSIYRPQINRAAANILLATGEQIPIQIARIAKRAAERANGRSRALPIAPPAGGAPPVPPAGGTPPRSAGFGIGPGTQATLQQSAVGSLGGSAYGSQNDVNGDGVIDEQDAYAGAFMGGVGLPLAARGVRTVGRPRGAVADTASAGVGTPNTPQQAARFETPGSPEYQEALLNGDIRPTSEELYDALRQARKDGNTDVTEIRAIAEAVDRIENGAIVEVISDAFKKFPVAREVADRQAMGYTNALMSDERAAIAIVQRAIAEARLQNKNPEAVFNEALTAYASRFSDPEDAAFMRQSITDLMNRGNLNKAASPILTAGFGARAPVPPPKAPGKLGTRTADAAAIAMLATGGPTAEADTGGATTKADTGTDAQARIAELAQLQASKQANVDEYEQALKAFEALPPTEKQVFLKNSGYRGAKGESIKPDGDVQGITGFAMDAYRAKINADIAAAKAERDGFKKEINDIRVALAQKPEKQTNPLIDKLTEYGTYGAVAYLAHRGRGAMVKGSQVTANRAAAKANALLTRLPVPPEAPRKTLVSRVPILGNKQKARIKRETTAANKAQFATEERLSGRDIPPISSNPTSPDGLPVRLANVDEFDRQAAAGDFGPVSRIGRFMEPVNSRFRGSDLAVIGTGAADTYITEGMIQKTREDIVAEEKKLAKALADDDPDAIGLSTTRLEQLRQAETVQVILQRIGIGMMIGGGFGLTHGRYARPQPRYEAAARERDLINRAMAPAPAAPPPAPPAPLPTPVVNTPAPAPAPAKPRTVGKPKPKPLNAEELRKLAAMLQAAKNNKD